MPGLSMIIDGLSGGFLGYLLMYFSIRVNGDTILDFRYIPVMLLVLFVGKRPALISSLVIGLSRFQIGAGRSAESAVYLIGILLAGYLVLDEFFKNKENILKKGMFFTLYSNIIVTFFLIYLIEGMNLAPLILLFWLISTLAGMSAVYLVNYIRNSEYLFNKYQIESSTDFLTGLSNVRRFEAFWEKVSLEAQMNQESVALIMLDIDHFKRTNDAYGHSAGDYVLVELGRILEEVIHKNGMAFRKGGEEFAVVLPKSDKAEAVQLAEAIRRKVEQHHFITHNLISIPVTVSIGVTVYPETINQLSDMIEMADVLLYKSKHEGRNRVSV
ncbi:diguanylate cyclase [Alkalibacterium subtropicum]|uniref:diguanylate cyclase n=1 Tax=Alkalibacterium subtropicum TaxID=753702 RepID=UPI0015A65440|nr:diguanylate cyclase [Alkalibacterium subtropicum]